MSEAASAVTIDMYESAMLPARRRFEQRKTIGELLADNVEPNFLLAFLIHFCSLGVAMTAPVESWIRRAGERCVSAGHLKLGKALQGHARHEAGHDELMRRDTHALVDHWNHSRNGLRPLDADILLGAPMTPGIERYRLLHENIINSKTPYCQIAIEYEIEKLSVEYGGRLVQNCAKRIGSDVVACLSFVQEHVALDVGHTTFNRKQLSGFLADNEAALPHLIRAGADALQAYGDFLEDCASLGAPLLDGQV